MQLELKSFKTKNKTYIEFKDGNFIERKFKRAFTLNNGQVVAINYEHNLILLETGALIFPNIYNETCIYERYNNFEDKKRFWRVIESAPSLEEQKLKWEKFGNSIVQDSILKKLGLSYSNFKYYCKYIKVFTGYYKFDVVAIDDALKNMYEDYKEGMSMKEFIALKFGEDLANQIAEYF